MNRRKVKVGITDERAVSEVLNGAAYILLIHREGIFIDEKTLVKALNEGRISGSALDVMEEESPDPKNELFRLDNVLLTPPISSVTPEMDCKKRRVIAAKKCL